MHSLRRGSESAIAAISSPLKDARKGMSPIAAGTPKIGNGRKRLQNNTIEKTVVGYSRDGKYKGGRGLLKQLYVSAARQASETRNDTARRQTA
jgi:hypothetical protein